MKFVLIILSLLASVSFSEPDQFRVSLRKSARWLEIEKNGVYTICTDDAYDGFWKVDGFSYKKDKNCVRLNSGNFVKSGKIWYVTKMGNVFDVNLLVGMKYVDLSTRKHWVGFKGKDYVVKKNRRQPFQDSLRLESINEVLAVDEYKVTECEFVYALWDSIPENVVGNDEYQTFWIEKKKSMKRDGRCDAHDSAAVRIHLYHAFLYANARSVRDGFRPVYLLEKTNDTTKSFDKNGAFNISETSFEKHENKGIVRVKADESADGYRLPFYYEWVAFAGDDVVRDGVFFLGDSARVSRYAWFGVRDPNDIYSKMDERKYMDEQLLKGSCGKWLQKSRPVGLLEPNAYGLYDIFGLVCERVLLPGKSIFYKDVASCKGGFLTSSYKEIDVKTHCDDSGFDLIPFQGLRLVRRIK